MSIKRTSGPWGCSRSVTYPHGHHAVPQVSRGTTVKWAATRTNGGSISSRLSSITWTLGERGRERERERERGMGGRKQGYAQLFYPTAAPQSWNCTATAIHSRVQMRIASYQSAVWFFSFKYGYHLKCRTKMMCCSEVLYTWMCSPTLKLPPLYADVLSRGKLTWLFAPSFPNHGMCNWTNCGHYLVLGTRILK